MKRKFKKYGFLIFLIIGIFYVVFSPGLKARNTEKILKKYYDEAEKACKAYHLPVGIYLSVIYAERLHNINDLDRADFTRASLGFDASVGFGQLKISTVEWMESEYPDCLPFEPSQNRSRLVNRLAHADTNIIYSVLYCRLITDHFEEKFGYPADVATVASYYGRGIDYGKGVHDEFYLNHLGLTANDYFRRNFPEESR